MELNLNKNIQSYRKAKQLTQEQLAEAMGVTIGAVSKWENGLSNPDLYLIIELADFFEVSVDVLLGYKWERRHMGTCAARIKALRSEKHYKEAVQEASKALTKYPNSFEVTYQSALLYRAIGMEKKEAAGFTQALKLFEQSLELIDQNTDEKLSAETIHIEIAVVQGFLGQVDEAIERLKKHNPCGVNDALIGSFYVNAGRQLEGEPYFAEAMEVTMTNLFRCYVGIANCYLVREEYARMMVFSEWMCTLTKPLMEGKARGYNAKFLMISETLQALGAIGIGDEVLAEDCLRRALHHGIEVDKDVDFELHIKFIPKLAHTCVDDIGDSETFFTLLKDEVEAVPVLAQSFKGLYERLKEEVKHPYA